MNYWLFKCDPKRYRIADRLALEPNPEVSWTVSRYRQEIAPGDLWKWGPDLGLAGVMEILTAPEVAPELPHEIPFWLDASGAGPDWRVFGRLTRRFITIPKAQLAGEPGLSGLPVFEGFQQGTNFRVPLDAGETLMSFLNRQVWHRSSLGD